MKRFLTISKKLQRMDSTKPLMKNNNDIYDDHESERDGKGRISQELLSVCSDDASDNECFSSDRPEPYLAQRSDDQYTLRSEPLSLPDPPADLDQHLDQHLGTVDEIVKNSPSTSGDDFLCQICTHLDALLQNISTTKSCLILINWVSRRKELLDPDLDLLECSETKAKEKLLERAKEEVHDSLEKILDADRKQTDYNEEFYIQLYLDIIQCVNAKPKLLYDINVGLSYQVKNICFQELQSFVKRYTSEQAEILREKAQTWRQKVENPEMIHFLKTLKTCKELRQHIQTEGNAKSSSVDETKKTLETMEALTLELIKKIVTELAESCLKDYFKSANRPNRCLLLCQPGARQCNLFASLQNHFPRLSYALDEQRIVMDEVYKIVAHSYLKHLIQKSRRTLKMHWRPDVRNAVQEDADLLHTTISDLAPGVQQWNRLLLMIQEVLDCKNLDTLKLIIGSIQGDLGNQSEDLELLPRLLRWKGLSKGQVREVLDALPDSLPTSSSGSFSSCFCCCS